MATTYSLTGDGELQETRTETASTTYDRAFLGQQRELAAAELARLDALIAEYDRLAGTPPDAPVAGAR